MSIKHAILGMLSYQPQTGYDLKKQFADSPVLYWSGNNNQIYRALVELLDDGLVQNEVHLQEKLPAKKVYSITEKGLLALKHWSMSAPEPLEYRNSLLIQLLWADQLSPAELDALLAGYEQEMKVQLLMLAEKARRGQALTPRTQREALLWGGIYEHVTALYGQELAWVRQLRSALGGEGNGAGN